MSLLGRAVSVAALFALVLAGTADAEFVTRWTISGNCMPSFASRYEDNGVHTAGNVVRTPAVGRMRDDNALFMLVGYETGQAIRMVDLSTGNEHEIDSGLSIPRWVFEAKHVQVSYLDVDDDSRDECLLWCSNWGFVCIDWQAGPYAGTGEEQQAPGSTLANARPNPSNGVTSIGFSLGADGHVGLQIFDINGRLVRSLVDGDFPAGNHRISWDGLDDSKAPVTSGTYYYRLIMNGTIVGTDTQIILR